MYFKYFTQMQYKNIRIYLQFFVIYLFCNLFIILVFMLTHCTYIRLLDILSITMNITQEYYFRFFKQI